MNKLKIEFKNNDIIPVLNHNFLIQKGSKWIKYDESLNELDEIKISSQYSYIISSPNGNFFVCHLYKKKRIKIFDSISMLLIAERSIPFDDCRIFVLDEGTIFVVKDDCDNRESMLYYFSKEHLLKQLLKIPFLAEIKQDKDGIYLFPPSEQKDLYTILKISNNLSFSEIVFSFNNKWVPFFEHSFFVDTGILCVEVSCFLFRKKLIKIDIFKNKIIQTTTLKGTTWFEALDPNRNYYLRKFYRGSKYFYEVYSINNFALLNKFQVRELNLRLYFSNDGNYVVFASQDTVQLLSYNEFQHVIKDWGLLA